MSAFLKAVTFIPLFFLSIFGSSHHAKVTTPPHDSSELNIASSSPKDNRLAISQKSRAPSTQQSPVSGIRKEVALTFDDGPYGTSTQQIIDILQREQVTATFFMVGQNVKEYPALAQEIARDGYAIGNHTYTHPDLARLSLIDGLAQVRRAEAIIASTTGVHTMLFRPPYGTLSKALPAQLMAEGYRIVLWNVDPRDWDHKNATSERIILNILGHLKPRMIIDLHDGRDTHVNYPRDNLINALPSIIRELKASGYTFVTVDQMAY